MGTMNIVGTLASGWLTDRYDNRRLLAAYYGFRALSIAALPLILDVPQLFLFAIVYGLDWIATVPPTANLTARIFGRGSLGTIYGWIFCQPHGRRRARGVPRRRLPRRPRRLPRDLHLGRAASASSPSLLAVADLGRGQASRRPKDVLPAPTPAA